MGTNTFLTRRRDQVHYAGTEDGNELVGGVIVAETVAGRDAWMDRLAKLGFNHFTRFRDVRGPALQFGRADWVPAGGRYVNW